jgi:hypothetical protein
MKNFFAFLLPALISIYVINAMGQNLSKIDQKYCYDLQKRIINLQEKEYKEITGQSGSSYGNGPAARAISKQIEDLSTERDSKCLDSSVKVPKEEICFNIKKKLGVLKPKIAEINRDKSGKGVDSASKALINEYDELEKKNQKECTR